MTDFAAECDRSITRTKRALADVYRGLNFLATREAWHDEEDERELEALFTAYRAARRAVKAMEAAQLPALVKHDAA